ncbi:Oidioi.mRNA.OKI2018_I69.chr1.g3612.t1.cds [Oikopleura dioica]|uniref:Oidioi.mRNA.OKI2018_I69.chr1.g3612.t1.cds n=1 Tax=Oikopleura dioica TaxID=34765 RepID=A0ABN7SYZ1_OIKDI|nr:Oidioi.mRNA.OKI2018_I69.chr1.g3612.t1.cds [Oikopleura dioica]
MPAVKCLECHCVGTVMNTSKGVVLLPSTVKKTLIVLGGGMLPKLKKVEPTMRSAFEQAKDFAEGFNQTIESEEDEINGGFIQRTSRQFNKIRSRFEKGKKNVRNKNRMTLAEKIALDNRKTPAPKQFTGLFSDEYEKEDFWKSWKRFSLHGNATQKQFIVYMLFGCAFWGIIIGITNYYSMLAAQIQPTYLTNVCQVGFKKCTLTHDMNYCAHLLHDCIGTKTFTQPAEVTIPEKPKETPLEFTEKENEINAFRCKKRKFYAMVSSFS